MKVNAFLFVVLILLNKSNIGSAQSCSAGTISASKDSTCWGTVDTLFITKSIGNIQWQRADYYLSFSDIIGANDTFLIVDTLTLLLPPQNNYRVIARNGSTCADTSLVFNLFLTFPPGDVFSENSLGDSAVFIDACDHCQPQRQHWDFGDGDTSSSISYTTHVYDSSGTYHVCLTSYGYFGCNSVYCRDIVISATGIEKVLADNKLSIYPNPVDEQLTLSSQQLTGSRISIIDLLGRTIITESPVNNKTDIDITKLNAGIYFVAVKSDNGLSSVVRRFVKQ